MRVVVVGGAGAFGSRLVEMLVRDGHAVWIAGRRPGTTAEAALALGASPLVLKGNGNFDPLWAVAPQVVVDASGPFHAYGADPYRLPKAAIARGVNYCDLADDAEFCAGICGLDAAARAAGVFALSGLSSVPAISAAAVSALAKDDPIDMIATAILPGNRAPRGRSVIASILHQVGRDFTVIEDGRRTRVRGWSSPRRFDLGPAGRRWGWQIAVPDQQLFPDRFAARSVSFHAGLELGIMNRALALLSGLRGLGVGLATPDWLVAAARGMARLLAPFGTDTGGMVVAVTCKRGDQWERRQWRLIAGQGDGPYVPGIAARAVLRQPGRIRPGARPALGEPNMSAITEALTDLSISTDVTAETRVPLFRRVLGDKIDQLPREVQDLHDVPGVRIWQGMSSVSRGSGPLARAIAALFRFPAAGETIPVRVRMVPRRGGEIWTRHFGNSVFASRLRATAAGMTERFGPFTFLLDLHVADGSLHFPVRRGWFLGVPLPRALLPRSDALETAADGKARFDVALSAPLGIGLIVHYRGWLAPVGEAGPMDENPTPGR